MDDAKMSEVNPLLQESLRRELHRDLECINWSGMPRDARVFADVFRDGDRFEVRFDARCWKHHQMTIGFRFEGATLPAAFDECTAKLNEWIAAHKGEH